MVIDTSAIFASISKEPDSAIYRSAIKEAPLRLISAITLLQTRIVLLARIGEDAIKTLDELIEQAQIEVVAFDGQQVAIALGAFKRYGKGRGHPAQLNIIDCAAYALASSRNLPLLFKGNDFARTDVKCVLPSR